MHYFLWEQRKYFFSGSDEKQKGKKVGKGSEETIINWLDQCWKKICLPASLYIIDSEGEAVGYNGDNETPWFAFETG